jgi:bacterioferritin (cytochrome b1)
VELQTQGNGSSNLGNEGRWTHNPQVEEFVSQLNSILRGEIAAAETYAMAIEKMIEEGREPGHVALLRALRQEHVQAAQSIRGRIAAMGGMPEQSSGAWGAWAKFAIGTAQIFGDSAVLRTLKDGETHGLKDLEEAAKAVDAESAAMIESELVPAQGRHIRQLEEIINLLSS